jgi:O-antigen/teichoic acid export membrane protein
VYEQLRRLFRHSAAYTAGSMLNKAFAFLLVPIYTRSMTRGDYGDLALLGAGAAVLAVAYEFGISSAVMRFYYDYDDEGSRRRYIGSMWLFATAATGLVTLLLLGSGHWFLGVLFKDIPFWPYVGLTIMSTFLSAASVIPYVLIRIHEQSTRFVMLVLAQSVVLASGVLVFIVVLDMGLLGAVLAIFVQSCVVYVFFTAYTLHNASLRGVALSFVRSSVKYGLPVLLLQAGWWVLDASDRFLLRHWRPASIVALYSVGYAIGRILIMVSQAINQAWTPFFYATVKEKNPDAKRLFSYTATYYTLVVSSLGLVVVVFAREAVLFFGGHAYLQAERVTPLIMLAAVIQSMFYVPSRGIFLQKRTGLLPVVLGAGAAVNVGLNLWLIPAYGMMGAAVATVAGYAVAVAFTFVVSQRLYPIDYQVGRMATIFAVLIALSMAATLVHPSVWYVAVLWKISLLLAAPLALWALGFFEDAEIARLRQLLARRRSVGEAT